MTTAPFFPQNQLAIFDADVTTICPVNISDRRALYTSSPTLSPPSSPHTDTHSHTHLKRYQSRKEGWNSKTKYNGDDQPLQWPAGRPVGTVLKPKATVAKLFVSEMCGEVKW